MYGQQLHYMPPTITPWEVQGEVDYEKLIQQFGTEPITHEQLNHIAQQVGEVHYMLRRGVFFSHRDLDWLLNQYQQTGECFLYTGRAPSGNTHIGHLLPWVLTRWLQEKFNVDLWFQFPDEEKFLFKQDLSLEDTAAYTQENMLDVIALGFDPDKTHFLIDTRHAGILYKHACRVAKKITFSTAKAAFGFQDSSNIGSVFYTSMQAVPAFLPSAIAGRNIPCLIPLAIDQDPHFRVARDIYPSLGYYKPAVLHARFLPSLQGPEGKMSSSSAPDTIYTTDTQKQVEEKIKKYAYSGGRSSLQEHKEQGGNPDIDVSFQYLKMFFEPDDKKLQELEHQYRNGDLLTGELKDIAIDKINVFLQQHQKQREKARNKVEQFIYQAE